MENEIIYKGIFGSRLYGTETPTSDVDYKQIHKSSLAEIVLGNSIDNVNLSTNPKGRNTSEDVDFESKELRQFINDCLGGQTYAFDMLFTPKNLWEYASPIWKSLIKERDKLLTRNIKPFIGYCKSQSMKYSAKGEKLRVLKELRGSITEADLKLSLGEFFNKNPKLLELPFVREYDKEIGKGDSKSIEYYYDLVQSSAPSGRQVAEALGSIDLQLKNYGKRAEDAMVNGNIDLKAYYHAVRICWELEEYLTTGKITFPHPKKDMLLAIRLGNYSKEFVEALINEEIERVLMIPNTLPEANYDYWNEWILDRYIGKRKSKIHFAKK